MIRICKYTILIGIVFNTSIFADASMTNQEEKRQEMIKQQHERLSEIIKQNPRRLDTHSQKYRSWINCVAQCTQWEAYCIAFGLSTSCNDDYKACVEGC